MTKYETDLIHHTRRLDSIVNCLGISEVDAERLFTKDGLSLRHHRFDKFTMLRGPGRDVDRVARADYLVERLGLHRSKRRRECSHPVGIDVEAADDGRFGDRLQALCM